MVLHEHVLCNPVIVACSHWGSHGATTEPCLELFRPCEGAAMLTDDAVLAMKKSLLSETHGKSHILYYSSETPVCT